MTSLSEQLKSSKSAGSRVIFLALKGEIMTAIGEGWTIKDAWDQLHQEGKFPFTYALFVRHFNRFCRDKEPAKTTNEPTIQPAAPTQKERSPEPKTAKPDTLIIVGNTRKNPFVASDPLADDENLI